MILFAPGLCGTKSGNDATPRDLMAGHVSVWWMGKSTWGRNSRVWYHQRGLGECVRVFKGGVEICVCKVRLKISPE